jgi:hypothetical protein
MRHAALAITAFLASAAPASAETFSCTPPAADLAHPTPLHLTQADIAGLVRSYRSPEVRGLRSAIETYLAGHAKPRPAALLNNTSKSVLRQRFTIMADDHGLLGGYFLVVQFKSHAETMYRAWVYDVGREWDLRAWDVARCTPQQQRWLRIRYGGFDLPVNG